MSSLSRWQGQGATLATRPAAVLATLTRWPVQLCGPRTRGRGGACWGRGWVRKLGAQITRVSTVSQSQVRSLSPTLGVTLFGRAIVHVPSSLCLLCPLHRTHRRASETGGRDLVLLGAALLLSHGAEPVLHSPEQHGVQISVLSRGHLNDWGHRVRAQRGLTLLSLPGVREGGAPSPPRPSSQPQPTSSTH